MRIESMAPSSKLSDFVRQHAPETPFLVVDLDVVRYKFLQLKQAFVGAECCYSVKANPASEVLSLLAKLGASFEVASLNELQRCLAAGADATRMLFGNPIKRPSHVAAAFALGVRRYAFDSQAELEKIAAHAPGSQVYCRIKTSNPGAIWPLSKKFGCGSQRAIELMTMTQSLGLQAYGISFHVGSQQLDPLHWQGAIKAAADVMHALSERGVTCSVLNVGGGFPATYRNSVTDIEKYAGAINSFVHESFGAQKPQLIVEPGRCIVAEAGTIFSQVLLIRNDPETPDKRWVYLDIGRFNGLMEAAATDYPINAAPSVAPSSAVVIAGPSCDSADVLYENEGYTMPNDLKIGDVVWIHCSGAYTTAYACRDFNGIEALHELFLV